MPEAVRLGLCESEFLAERAGHRRLARGVTLGLLQHHFKTKAGLRRAVDQLVVDDFAQTVAAVPTDGTPAEVASARDEAVRRMLEQNPPVVNYIRRVMLEPWDIQQQLPDDIVDFTRSEIGMLRDAGLASKKRRESHQIVAVLVRQFGELLLQPMLEAVWEREASKGEKRPHLIIRVAD
jgi:AcrR family transcriptional regulator